MGDGLGDQGRDDRIAVGWSRRRRDAPKRDFHARAGVRLGLPAPRWCSTSSTTSGRSRPSRASPRGEQRHLRGARPRAIGIPALRVDGNDYPRRARRDRNGPPSGRAASLGPTLIELRHLSRRRAFHLATTRPAYRPKDRCRAPGRSAIPIERLKTHLIALGEWSRGAPQAGADAEVLRRRDRRGAEGGRAATARCTEGPAPRRAT